MQIYQFTLFHLVLLFRFNIHLRVCVFAFTKGYHELMEIAVHKQYLCNKRMCVCEIFFGMHFTVPVAL